MQRTLFFATALGLSLAGLSAALTQAAEVIKPADQRFAAGDVQEVPSFQKHVLPLMGRLGCNGRACHGSFQGQGGFRLSLFGYDFKMDHDALAAGDSPRIDLKNPRESLMLEKATATNTDDHGGGHRMDVDSWQYRLILRWIESGATPVNEEKDAQFVRLEVTPLEIVFKKQNETSKLRILSHWSDGTVEDVTPLCRFQSNDEAVAKVDTAGKITVTGKGDTHIVAFYDNGVVPVSVLLPVSDQIGPKYPATPTPTKIDELVVNKLKKLGVTQSGLCSDGEFIRRASLDITGTLPAAEEVQKFLADSSPNKRDAKVNELLERPAYAAWWATKLSDTLGNSENQLRKGGQIGNLSLQWYQWLNRRIGENQHYDDLVHGIVLAVGRTSPDQSYEDYCRLMTDLAIEKGDPAERSTMPYYWARQNMRKPNEKALSFSYAFLGVRLQCAECHKHPFDQWSQQDFNQFTAFFNRINTGISDRKAADAMYASLNIEKKLPNNEKQKLTTKAAQEGKPIPFDEVYVTPANRTGGRRKDDQGNRMNVGRVITPKVLGGEEVVDASYDDPRQPLMDWLRQKDNPYFAKAFVNRVWAHYFNAGIVEPADDMNLANAPSNKELLDWLADEFIAHDYDMKWLHRTITGSRTYQLGWHTDATNEFDLRNYSHAVPRRLPAEVVYDAVVAATAGDTELAKRAADPVALCAIGAGKGYTQRNNFNSYALTVFGKPKRETPCDCERSNEPSLLQTVYLRNDQEMFKLIDRRDGWLNGALARLPRNESEVSSETDRKASETARMKAKLAETEQTMGKLARADKRKNQDQIAELAREAKELRTLLRRGESGERENEKRAGEKVEPATTADLIRDAYLRTVSRTPSDEELANAERYVTEVGEAATGLRDLVWALLNSKEFLVNH